MSTPKATSLHKLFAKKSILERFLLASWLVIIALIPFHAFISTWGGASIGPLEVWKSWKEILLLADLVVAFGYLWHRGLLKKFFADKLVWLIFAYAALHLLLWVIFRPPVREAMAGMLMNLRFLAIFLLSGVLLTFTDRRQLLHVTLYFVLGGALLVVVVAWLQQMILPTDFLAHFGYSQATITPYTTLDNNASIIRLQSTMRGPNPLGQYLIFVAALLAALWGQVRRMTLSICLLAVAAILVLTYSRSAWIGMFVAALAFIWLRISNKKLRRNVLVGAGALLVVLVGALAIMLPHSVALQNTLLHNKHGDSDVGSTTKHYQESSQALSSVLHHPLGQGPGTSGPASFYGPKPVIPEDYYLQLAGEVGVLGLAMFAAMVIMVARRLWPQRDEFWPQILLVSLAGLTAVNFFLHGWADDTMAILWWGLAGLFVFQLGKTSKAPLN